MVCGGFSAKHVRNVFSDCSRSCNTSAGSWSDFSWASCRSSELAVWESGTRDAELPGNGGTGGRDRGVLGVFEGRTGGFSMKRSARGSEACCEGSTGCTIG